MFITLTPNEGNVLLDELSLRSPRDIENFKKKLFKDAAQFVTIEHLEDGSVYFYIEEVFAMTLLNTMKPKVKYFMHINKSTIGLVKAAMEILKDVKKDYRDVINLAGALLRDQQREDGVSDDDDDALDDFYEDDDDDARNETVPSNNDNVINMPTSIHEAAGDSISTNAETEPLHTDPASVEDECIAIEREDTSTCSREDVEDHEQSNE